MEGFFAWCAANPELAIALLAVVADLVAGALPDRFTRWPGIILSAANKAFYFGKEQAPPELPKNVALEDLIERTVEKAIQKLIMRSRKARKQDADVS